MKLNKSFSIFENECKTKKKKNHKNNVFLNKHIQKDVSGQVQVLARSLYSLGTWTRRTVFIEKWCGVCGDGGGANFTVV